MSPADLKRPNSRDQLLDAARKLFVAKGYDAVSTREIAESAGVNLGSIQYYFGSKEKLFVEVVTTLMSEDQPVRTKAALEGECRTPLDAAAQLCAFVQLFIEYLVCHKDTRPCQMMVRELFSASCGEVSVAEILVSSVVRDYIAPLDESLRSVLQVIAPRAGEAELAFCANSVMGQRIYYLTHGPFISKLWQRDIAKPEMVADISRHVGAFALRGLGVDDELIGSALGRSREIAGEVGATKARGRAA